MLKEDHQEILLTIEDLLSFFNILYDSIQYYNTSYGEYEEQVSWINHQIISLKDALILVENNSYKSAFCLIRSAYEAFWILHLSMNGTKYFINYETNGNDNIQKVYQEWKKDFDENKDEYISKGILYIESPKKNKIKVIYKGIQDKNGRITPYYFRLFREYDPQIAHVGLEEAYFESEELTRKFTERIKSHKDLKWYFAFEQGIKYNLILNKLVTEEEFEKIKIHYNYLSMWTHPTEYSIKMIGDDYQKLKEIENITKYEFCLTRLTLLYIGNILVLFLHSFLKYCERQKKEKKIKGLRIKDDIKEKIKEFENKSDYFWFVFNKPHFYYKWKSASKLIWKKDMEKLDPNLLNEEDIEYYKNPLETLRDLSISKSNKKIGNYKSPIGDEYKNPIIFR